MSDRARVGTGIAAIVVAVVLFVVLSDGGDESEESAGAPTTVTTTTANGKPKPIKPRVPVVTVRGGEPVGGVQEIEVRSGGRVRFRVVSDAEGDVHVHGYNVEKPVAVGGSVSFDFPADLEGGYEVELHMHDAGEIQIAELRVQPG